MIHITELHWILKIKIKIQKSMTAVSSVIPRVINKDF